MPPAGGFPPPDGFAPQWGAPPPHAAPPFPPMPQMPPPGYAPMPGMNAPGMNAPQMFDPSQPMSVSQQPEPVVSNPYARKRKNGPGLTLWLSIGGAALVIGGIVAFFVLSQKDNSRSDAMKGELTGIRLLGGKLAPAIVHRDWINLDEEVTDAMNEHLKKHKYNLKSELEQLQFQGTDEGIKIAITPGPGAELVAVEINEDKKLSKWHAKNSASLNEKAQKQVIASAKKFVKESAAAQSRGSKVENVAPYRDELGIAALATGVGGEIIAVIGDRIHRCVAEQEGKLFFLLPRGTDHFTLQGRERGKDKEPLFPGFFKVEVSEEAMKPKKSNKKPVDEEPTEEEEKAAEMRTNAFGKPALNDPSAADAEMPEKPKAKKKTE